MLLMIDIGNTNITLGLYDGDERVNAWRLATVHDRMPDEYGLQILGLLEHAGCSVEQIKGCALASVVPPLTGTFVKAAAGYLGTEPLVIDAGVKTGLSIRYEDPKNALGADRVADAVAVRHFYGTPACVVDFGTATTFDAISAEGEYLGGAIAPGMDLAAESLFTRSAKLSCRAWNSRRRKPPSAGILLPPSNRAWYTATWDGGGSLCAGFAVERSARTKIATIATGGTWTCSESGPIYSIRRVVCRRCGVVREKVPWADKGSRFTKSFEQEVAWLAQRTDVSAVANYFRVTWRSVRRIIQRVVAEQRDERRELDGLRVIGMDEISYRKRHKYLTVVIDHLSGRVVWAGKERKAKTLLRFFRKLGPQRAAELEAVSMDMWEPYITVVGKKAPQARVIFDRFHIVKHLNEAVDKTRRELVRELKGTARRNLKNTKFPLLKAKHNRSAKDKRVLREQVRANRRLYRAMLLRDDFMDLYTYKTETWAKKFLRGWLRRAMSSRIEPVKRAAKMIRSHFDGVIAWVTWRLSNGRLEGMNNKIRLLSHRSFGLHSAEALISLVYLNCGGLTLERIH